MSFYNKNNFRPRKLLRNVLLSHGGLDILMDVLENEKSDADLFSDAVLSVKILSEHVGIVSKVRSGGQGCQMVYMHIFKPEIQVWANFGGSRNGRCRYILWPFGQFSSIWRILWPFGIFSPFWLLYQEKSGNPGELTS
jgi:hypothetical protein